MASGIRDARGGEEHLIKVMGTWALAATILNITIGGGIFRLPSEVSRTLGAAGPLGYIICACAMGLIVLCIAEAGSRVALTGGPYAYVEVAFGPFAGYLAGVLLWLLGTFAMAAVSTAFVENMAVLWPWLRAPAGRWTFLLAVYGFFAVVNVRGVEGGSRVNTVLTVAKLLPLLLLAVGGWWGVRSENLAIASWPDAPTLARSTMFLMFAFAGIESALVPSGEVRDPARTIPRAIFTAMVGITLLYLVLQVVSRGVLGESLSTTTAPPLAEAAGMAMGDWARLVLVVGASIAMFGHAGGMVLALSRVLFAFARDGVLPRVFATVHPQWRTPAVAIGVQAAVAAVLAGSSSFARLAVLANVSVLLLYGACCLAAWQLRRRGIAQSGSPFRIPLPGVLPWAGVLVIGWMLTSISLDEWRATLLTLGIASVLYLLARRSARGGEFGHSRA